MGLFYGSPGIVRSSSGNLPHILDRVAAHRKALYSVLPAGIARRHNTNQAAGIKVPSTGQTFQANFKINHETP